MKIKIFTAVFCILMSIQNCFAGDNSLMELQFGETFVTTTIDEVVFIIENKEKLPNTYKLFSMLNDATLPEASKGIYEEAGDENLAYCMFNLKPSELREYVLADYKNGKFNADDLFVLAEVMYSFEKCSDITQTPGYDRKLMMAMLSSSFNQEMKKEYMDTLVNEPQVKKTVVTEEFYE